MASASVGSPKYACQLSAGGWLAIRGRAGFGACKIDVLTSVVLLDHIVQRD